MFYNITYIMLTLPYINEKNTKIKMKEKNIKIFYPQVKCFGYVETFFVHGSKQTA